MQRAKQALRPAAASALLFFLLAVPAFAHAQLRDHLKCYRIALPTGFKFSPMVRDLDDRFGLEAACSIFKPAELCVPAEKIPGAAPLGPAAGHFIRYKLKCPRFTPRQEPVVDQFLLDRLSARAILRASMPISRRLPLIGLL